MCTVSCCFSPEEFLFPICFGDIILQMLFQSPSSSSYQLECSESITSRLPYNVSAFKLAYNVRRWPFSAFKSTDEDNNKKNLPFSLFKMSSTYHQQPSPSLSASLLLENRVSRSIKWPGLSLHINRLIQLSQLRS